MKHTMISGQESGRRRRSDEEIAALLREYRSRGITQAAFAQLKGVSLSTVSRWLHRSTTIEGGDAEEIGHRLVPVRLADDVRARWGRGRPAFELMLPGGPRLSIPSDFEAADLRRLIAVLRETDRKSTRLNSSHQ